MPPRHFTLLCYAITSLRSTLLYHAATKLRLASPLRLYTIHCYAVTLPLRYVTPLCLYLALRSFTLPLLNNTLPRLAFALPCIALPLQRPAKLCRCHALPCCTPLCLCISLHGFTLPPPRNTLPRLTTPSLHITAPCSSHAWIPSVSLPSLPSQAQLHIIHNHQALSCV